MKNGFAAAQKSFPLRERPDVIMIQGKPLTLSLERRKTFDSPLANHFSFPPKIERGLRKEAYWENDD